MPYEMYLLSQLQKQSRYHPQPDYLLAIDFIYDRLGAVNPDSRSQFDRLARWIKKIPQVILIKLLSRLRYDAMIGICEEENQRQVYGVLAFQRHPQREMIGMFYIYLESQRRGKDLFGGFQIMAELIYNLTHSFKESGYKYIQCGNNETTRRFLRLYQRVGRQKNWGIKLDVETTRIYL